MDKRVSHCHGDSKYVTLKSFSHSNESVFPVASPPDEALPVFALLLATGGAGRRRLAGRAGDESLKKYTTTIIISHRLSLSSHASVLLCRCLRSVCPAQDSLFFFQKKINVFFWGGGKRWPQMVSTQGDFCPHARVHGGQPTVIFRVPFISRKVNAWICPCRATDRDLQSLRAFFCECLDMCSAEATDRDVESVSARFFVRMLGCVLVGQPTVIFRVSSHVKE